MPRRAGSTSFIGCASMLMLPSEMSSRPAIILSSVDFHSRRADEDAEGAVLDGEVDPMDDLDGAVAFANRFQIDPAHDDSPRTSIAEGIASIPTDRQRLPEQDCVGSPTQSCSVSELKAAGWRGPTTPSC